MEKIGIYPGSFDPVTNGHLDVINRARRIFDKVVVAVARNAAKEPTFSSGERVRLIEENLVNRPNISVIAFDGLIVDLARDLNAVALIRGLRAVSDFEHEFQLASMNRQLAPGVETLFLTPAEQYAYISSSLVKEVAALDGDVSRFVHPAVEEALRRRVSRGNGNHA